MRATYIRVSPEARRYYAPWNWSYRRLYAIGCWCWELNLGSLLEQGAESPLNQSPTSPALLFLLIYAGFHLQPFVATAFFSFTDTLCVWACTCGSQGQLQAVVLFSHPVCPRDWLQSPAWVAGTHPFPPDSLSAPPPTNFCFCDILFFEVS